MDTGLRLVGISCGGCWRRVRARCQTCQPASPPTITCHCLPLCARRKGSRCRSWGRIEPLCPVCSCVSPRLLLPCAIGGRLTSFQLQVTCGFLQSIRGMTGLWLQPKSPSRVPISAKTIYMTTTHYTAPPPQNIIHNSSPHTNLGN